MLAAAASRSSSGWPSPARSRSCSPARASAPSSRSRRSRARPSPPPSSATGLRSTASRLRGPGRLDRGVAGRLHDPPHLRLAVPPDRRRRGRDEPLPPLRQLVPERHVPRRPVPDPLRLLGLPPAAVRLPRPDARRCSTSASAAARRRSGPGATSRACGSTPSSSTRRWSTSPTSTSSSRATRAWRSRWRTAAASSPQNDGPWDVIVVDAFYSDSIPFHLATREFLELAKSRLTPGGLVVTNIIGAVRGPRLAPLPLDAAHLPGGLPDGRDPPASSRAAATSGRSATSSSSPARAPHRRSSSCSSAGTPFGERSPGAPDLDAGDPRAGRRAGLDRGRAGADRRLRADRRAAAALRLAQSVTRRR